MGDTVPLHGDLRGEGRLAAAPLHVSVVPTAWLHAQASGRGADTGNNSGSGTDGNHLLARGVREGVASDSPPLLVSGVVVDDAAFHPARDGDDLTADVAGEDIGGQHDNLGCHVLGLRDLS